MRTYINERLNGINAPQVIRNFGKDHAICQKHLLERSIADTGETQPHPFPSAYDANNPFLATLKVNRELLQSDARSCMHIEFDIDGSNMQYEAGDHIGLYPTNESELVEKLGTLCGADLDAHISLHDSKLCSNTFRTALTHHIEIATVPQIHMLKALTEYCTDETDKRFLELISSPSVGGRDLYQTWVLDAKRNIVHVLEDIKSCHPPIDFVCQMLPKMQPRYYSISSSSRLHPNIVHMTVVLVKYETKSGRINKGVATAFLANNNLETKSSDGTRIPVFIRKSQFHLPPNTQTPIIMIGTGTGLAPFRGFIQHRNQAREEGDLVGDTILYFGARKRSEDFIYEEVFSALCNSLQINGRIFSFKIGQELKTYVQNGALKMHTAFSRDQQEKKYVTHLIHDDADVIWQVIGNMGHIYICG